MTQELKKGDKVRIINNALFAGKEGVIKGLLNGMKDVGNGPEKVFLVKLDIKDKQGKNVQEKFALSELERLL